MNNDTQTITVEDAEALISAAFLACGISRVAAMSVAHALVAAEAEGQNGHGFSRVNDYVAQIKSGKINGEAELKIDSSKPGAIRIDADYGFAYPALDLAVETMVPVVRSQGVVSVGIFNSHHCGALSVQVSRLAERGLVAMMVANAPAAMAPWGGNTPVFGTNPIAFAAPRGERPPLVIDLSLSKVARGKVMNAHKTGKTIPKGWALDENGNPTTNPAAALAGTMLPIGEAKGTALALMVEVMASLLTGANFSKDAGSFFSADGSKPGTGQFLMAFDPYDRDEFVGRIEQLVSMIETIDGARLPGSRRAEMIERSKTYGIRVPKIYLDDAHAIAASNPMIEIRKA
ncbi:MAG: Ldh family oxidoreductase [Pseudomonadota bacterium]